MKLICLNIWGGKMWRPLLEYLEAESADTDIFCFQEIFHTDSKETILSSGARADCLAGIRRALPGFDSYYEPSWGGYDFDLQPVPFDLKFGQAIFVNTARGLGMRDRGALTIFGGAPELSQLAYPRNLVYASVGKDSSELFVGNVHGLLEGREPKADSPARREQSRRIRSLLAKTELPKILCGDFNALPDIQAVRMLEEGMINLVRENRIPRTRNDHYPGLKKFGDALGDYAFISPDVRVRSFAVPEEVDVSDHLPLVLEFEAD